MAYSQGYIEMNDNELKDEIYGKVNELLAANHTRLATWEKGVIGNLQGATAELLREIMPQPARWWEQLVFAIFQGTVIGLSIGVALHFFK